MTYKSGAVIAARGRKQTLMSKEWDDFFEEVKYSAHAASTDLKYEFWEEQPNNATIVFSTGDDSNNEMLKITPNGFYVRGMQVEQGPGEAEAVYKAFKEFMTWAIISKPE